MEPIIVPEDKKKERLDKFLTDQLSLSRSQIKKRIEQGLVFVNGQTTTVHHFLQPGDKVEFYTQDQQDKTIPKIPVIAKTKDYLVIDKPAGLLTHAPNTDSQEVSVVDWLKKHHPKIKNVGDPERPGIVHRLDRQTSGVMVIAKTEEMYESLKQQFHDRVIKKEYLALVQGTLPREQDEIDSPIGRSKKGTRMATRVKKLFARDRDAITRYEVIEHFLHYDYVKAFPLTGRTHQIRVHFHSLGHPVAGDHLYRIHQQKDFREFPRLFLHATSLSFKDIKGVMQTFTSPLPQDLQEQLNDLR